MNHFVDTESIIDVHVDRVRMYRAGIVVIIIWYGGSGSGISGNGDSVNAEIAECAYYYSCQNDCRECYRCCEVMSTNVVYDRNHLHKY